MDLTLFAGPAGLAIAASLAVIALWRAHTKSDERDAEVIKVLTAAVKEFPGALKNLTEVVVDSAAHERERGSGK